MDFPLRLMDEEPQKNWELEIESSSGWVGPPHEDTSDPTVIILCGWKKVFLDPFQSNWKVFKPKMRTDSPLGEKLSNIKHRLTCPGPQLAMTFDSCFKPTFQSHCRIHASKKSHPQGYSPSLSIYFWPFIRVNTLHLTTARGTHYLSTLEMPAMRSCRTSNLKV